MIWANLERSFVLETYIMKPLTFSLLLVYSFKVNLLFFNDSQKVLCPKTKTKVCRVVDVISSGCRGRACLFYVYCLSLLCLVLLPSPLSALLNLLGSNLRGFSNKAPSVYLPVGWNNAWVSDVWDVGHSIQGSGEDVSCLAKTLDLWCRSLSAFMDQRWKDSLVLSSNPLPTPSVPLHSHFFSFRPILHIVPVGRHWVA